MVDLSPKMQRVFELAQQIDVLRRKIAEEYTDTSSEFREGFVESWMEDSFKRDFVDGPAEVVKLQQRREISQVVLHPLRKVPREISFVRVRPANASDTQLGLLLGDLPLGVFSMYDQETAALHVHMRTNPAILLLSGEVIYGAESWWQKISLEEAAKAVPEISDEAIRKAASFYLDAAQNAARNLPAPEQEVKQGVMPPLEQLLDEPENPNAAE